MISIIRCLVWLPIVLSLVSSSGEAGDKPWKRHTIDASSRGADGVRLADVNGDGLLDITTGWEEGGQVRVYLNPGPAKTKQTWPAVTVGRVKSPEDAVFADVDGDGSVDVISCCEGRTRSLFVHWAPKNRSDYLQEHTWKTEAIPASKNRLWMFALPLQLDGKHGVDIVAGAKGRQAEIGWWEAPANPRNLADWTWHGIYKAGWIMSLFAIDIDGDGDKDIVTSDRKGKNRGCHWLENPGPGDAQRKPWKVHSIGGRNREVMFMKPCDLDGDGRQDFLVATSRPSTILFLRRTSGKKPRWTEHRIHMPKNVGGGKGVAVADVDGDGRQDIVLTFESAKGKSGAVWLSRPSGKTAFHPQWVRHEISGRKRGIKYDRLEMIDLDGDGDLDLLTCEERDKLGVFWYENPTR
ncbi:MAG: hypothetical protein Tsb009_09090 [Planctomycetaceae bacterium]